MLFTLIIAYFIIGVLEAWVEKYVLLKSNFSALNYKELDQKEHSASAYYSIFVGCALGLGFLFVGDWKIFLAWVVITLPLRRLSFDNALKKFRGGRIRDIVGTKFIDRSSRNIFGATGGWREAAALVVIIGLITFICEKYF